MSTGEKKSIDEVLEELLASFYRDTDTEHDREILDRCLKHAKKYPERYIELMRSIDESDTEDIFSMTEEEKEERYEAFLAEISKEAKYRNFEELWADLKPGESVSVDPYVVGLMPRDTVT